MSTVGLRRMAGAWYHKDNRTSCGGRWHMLKKRRGSQGFTLIEVTFATGILFLTLVLLLGALSHLALVREMGERRHLATLCLNHCVEQLHASPGAAQSLHAPEGLPGDYDIAMGPAKATGAARIVVTTHTTRGHEISVSAVCPMPEVAHAP